MVLSTNRPGSESPGRDSNCTNKPYRAGRRRPVTVSSAPADAATCACGCPSVAPTGSLSGTDSFPEGGTSRSERGRVSGVGDDDSSPGFAVGPPAGDALPSPADSWPTSTFANHEAGTRSLPLPGIG